MKDKTNIEFYCYEKIKQKFQTQTKQIIQILLFFFWFNNHEIKPTILNNKICKDKHLNEKKQLRKYVQKIFFNPHLFPSNAEKC